MRSSRGRATYWRLLRPFLTAPHSSSAACHLPLYLCPAAARTCLDKSGPRAFPSLRPTRQVHTEHAAAHEDTVVPSSPGLKLPLQCSGCGALSQTTAPDLPGYFDPDRKAVKIYLGTYNEARRLRPEDSVVQSVLQNLDDEALRKIGGGLESLLASPKSKPQSKKPGEVPLCDRCHQLLHHHSGTSIFHPTIDSIRETIEESPYKYNHVYHVLDAADFPMSLLPHVHSLLSLMPLRSKNRRSRSGRFYGGKKTEMSFIITRSDLLAPQKEQIDRIMPILVEILRSALGRHARNVRLGNVRCVSAKRSWWTNELKEDIWKRGGAGWMVGKVNVGKSQLFEAVFPKGRMNEIPPKHQISVPVYRRDLEPPSIAAEARVHSESDGAEPTPGDGLEEFDELDEVSLLPPPQKETNYPQMPLVSSVPGTTASPIRVPFGSGKGELIDLPGLARSDLDKFVREEHRESLVMKARVTPEQMVVKPGQSILLGGFIRITPRMPDLIYLAYDFTPLEPHLTATEKAIAIQGQSADVKVENISVPGTGEKIKHAGSFELKWDVTKKRAGPITRKDAANIKVERLPYRVLAVDILIEGCGWVEIVAQVRTRNLFRKPPSRILPPCTAVTVGGEEILQSLDLSGPDEDDARPRADPGEPHWPIVDVYSPEGRFVGSRQPINAWLSNKPKKSAAAKRNRPRKSMVGIKRRQKLRERTTTMKS